MQSLEEIRFTINRTELFIPGGAGGTMRVNGFQGVSAELSVGSAKGSLTSLPLIIDDKIDFSHKEFYGLLGQDFINLFDEMTISSKCSSLILR